MLHSCHSHECRSILTLLHVGNDGFGNNGFRNKWNRPGFFPNNRFNQLGGGFPGRFGKPSRVHRNESSDEADHCSRQQLPWR